MNTTTPSVSIVIRDQISVPILMELGAHDLYSIKDGLKLNIKKHNRRILNVSITLDPSDTYTVAYWNNTIKGYYGVNKIEGIYVDQLRSTLLSLLEGK